MPAAMVQLKRGGAPDMSLGGLREAYRARALTPAQCVERALARVAAAGDNPIWIHLLPREAVLARAAELERMPAEERARRPLWGVPFAVKDNIDVAGLPTTAACPAYAYVPRRSARAVERLLDAGAILLGKTNLDQFATGLVGTRSPYGAVRNAFDARYISGGSSSGSAVAVALGMASFSLGTDTAGSGRVPAAFNNLVGLKPTRGLVSTRGVVPACRSLDCISVFAHGCADAHDVLAVLAAFDGEDPYSRTGAPLEAAGAAFRFALPRRSQFEFHGDREYARLFDEATARLEAIGGTRLEVDFAPYLEAQALLYDGPWVAERSAQFAPFLAAHAAEVHPVTRRVIESGARFSASDAFRAQHRLAELKRETESLWQAADVLVVPGAPTVYTLEAIEANPLELNSRLGRYTNFVNLLDLAAITVPAGFRADGLPFGITLVGPAFSDRSLAALGARLRGEAPLAPPERDAVRVAVVGAHLSGMPLNRELTERGAALLRAARTAPGYRLYALAGSTPPKPGLVRGAGAQMDAAPGIEVEVWQMPLDAFGAFVARIPAPLGIGTIELADGEAVKGFLCEQYAVADAADISAYGGWRHYLRALNDGGAMHDGCAMDDGCAVHDGCAVARAVRSD